MLIVAFIAAFIFFLFGPGTSSSVGETLPEDGFNQGTGSLLTELDEKEIAAEKYYRLIDSEGELITITGHRIRPGDRYLDEKNRLFEVRRVRGYTAEARYIRTEELSTVELGKSIVCPSLLEQLRSTVSMAAGNNDAGNKEEKWPQKGSPFIILIMPSHMSLPTGRTVSMAEAGFTMWERRLKMPWRKRNRSDIF